MRLLITSPNVMPSRLKNPPPKNQPGENNENKHFFFLNKLWQNEAIKENVLPSNQGSYVKTFICHEIINYTRFPVA